MDESKLVAICSENGKLFFNLQIELDEELAHAVYRFLVFRYSQIKDTELTSEYEEEDDWEMEEG